MSLAIYFKPRVLLLLLLGFVSGAPFLLTLSTLSFRLSEIGISKVVIGAFIFVSIPYSIKFLWAPIFDHYKIPFFSNWVGQKKSWGIFAQIGLMVSTIALGMNDPAQNLLFTGIWAACVSFFSASQDTIVDALRIELLTQKESGAGAAMEAIGFRFGMMLSGAGALYLASVFDWSTAYILLAFTNAIGIITMVFMPNPKGYEHSSGRNLIKVYAQSWFELFKKPYFISLVMLIFCFKMGDTVINSMISPFMWDLGYTKIEFANVTKVFGIVMMVAGGLLGGLMISQLGLIQSVIFCIVCQGLSCLLFVIQALVGHDTTVLYITVGIESLSSGMVSTAFIAYLTSFCKAPFSATHFTILYSIGSLSRVLISSAAGAIAEYAGWIALFALTSLVMIPSIFFVMLTRGIMRGKREIETKIEKNDCVKYV
jgi:PAT family beta-lactamase induction signal transducer AmpG